VIDRPLSKPEQQMLDNVEVHGWHCMNVFDPKGEIEPFAYSVGFTKTLGAPECIIFGLPSKLMHNMLWEMYRQLEGGAALSHGESWKNILEGFECVSLLASHPDLMSEYTTSAGWYERNFSERSVPEVYQIVWPGARDGLFPWDSGCSQDVINAQPQLWREHPSAT